MAFKFESEPAEFLTEWRNGTDFDIDESVVSYRVRGNANDLVQRRETITVQCLVNESLSLRFVYDSTAERIICSGLDFIKEGLFIGATIQVIQGINEGESTVENLTGKGFDTLFLDTTNLGFLTDGGHSDILIRVKDAPTYMRYQYGLIPDNVRVDTDELYASPLDGNIQAYYQYDIVTPSFEYLAMIRFGIFKGWDMTRDINVAFVQTIDTYSHQYEVIHTFRIPPYREEEKDNINRGNPPESLTRTRTYKYANKIFVGYSSEVVGSVTNLGVTGDVGYYNINYNGRVNNYTIASISITNTDGTGRMSVTKANTVTAKITNTDSLFQSDQVIVASVIRLAKSSDYSNNKDSEWNDIFVFSSARFVAGTAPVTSGAIGTARATFNDANDIDVDFTVTFDTTQKETINGGDQYAIIFGTGENGRPPDVEDNVSITVDIATFDKVPDVEDLISNVNQSYYDSYGALSGARAYTNQATWNGCFVGFDIDFRLVQFDDSSYTRILSAISRLILVSDTDPTDIRELWVKTLPVTPSSPLNNFVDGDFNYQIANGSTNDTDKLPTGEVLNINLVRSLPPYPADYQTFLIQGSIPRIPWRDWIENDDIPTVFFDADEPNDNLNQKTSNYSGLNGYSIFHEILLNVEYSYYVPAAPGSVFRLDVVRVTTPYQLRSDAFEVLDFDIDGNPSVVFEGEVNLYDLLGNETDYLSSDETRLVEIIITHDQGVLNKSDLWAEIWIEVTNATGEVWQLHSDKDFSHDLNPLTGSQEDDPANIDYVEIVSISNEVSLFCNTNSLNITSGYSYNIYYRLGKKTV